MLIITISYFSILKWEIFFWWVEYFHIICGQKGKETTVIRSDIRSLICGRLDMYVTDGGWSYKAENREDREIFFIMSFFLSLYPLSCRSWTSLRLSTKSLFRSLVNVCSFSADCCRDQCSVCWSFSQVHFSKGGYVWTSQSGLTPASSQAAWHCSHTPSPTRLQWDGKRISTVTFGLT